MCCHLAFASSSTDGLQVYQKNLHMTPEHRQKIADAISRYRNADNIWDVLREEFTLPHYEDNPAVQEKIQWFMNNQGFLLQSALRAAPYLYYILQQVKKRHLPAELVLLPIIESGYNPFNVSNMGAVGIWQLMPGTASDLGIKHDSWYDGRRDVITSTRAALNYLAYLQSFFEGNWLYTIAAYNTGLGNVVTAIKKNIRAGYDTSFWSLPVAQQTKDYVPSLLALAVILSNPDKYPIYFPPVRNAPYLAQIDVGSQINLPYAAALAGISYKKLLQLNSGFGRASTMTKVGLSKLVLPIENVEQFTENLSHSPFNTPIHWVHYKVKTGDTLASIAKKFSVSVNAIRQMNRLDNNNVSHDTDLLIPYNGNTTMLAADDGATSETQIAMKTSHDEKNSNETFIVANKDNQSANRAINLDQSVTNYTLQPGDTIYMTRPKDTLENIAKHFHIDAQTLRVANRLESRKIQAGKELIIPTHRIEIASTVSSRKDLEPGDTIYMVRHGDTIEKIASKFRTSPAAIRIANLMENNLIQDGDRLVIPTHMRG